MGDLQCFVFPTTGQKNPRPPCLSPTASLPLIGACVEAPCPSSPVTPWSSLYRCVSLCNPVPNLIPGSSVFSAFRELVSALLSRKRARCPRFLVCRGTTDPDALGPGRPASGPFKVPNVCALEASWENNTWRDVFGCRAHPLLRPF